LQDNSPANATLKGILDIQPYIDESQGLPDKYEKPNGKEKNDNLRQEVEFIKLHKPNQKGKQRPRQYNTVGLKKLAL
jgi:hypothetical protein